MKKRTKAGSKKQAQWKYGLITVIAIIIIASIILLSSSPVSRYRIGNTDAYIVGHDAVNRIKQLLEESSRVIIIAEGDNHTTQTTGFISSAVTYLARDFPKRLNSSDIYGIEYYGGRAIGCIGENASLDFCLNFKPSDKELLIKIKYPNYSENNILVYDNTIEFRGKSGADTLSLVKAFEQLFLGK
ncbi:hypothetical protein DRN74_02075 [Candidatus Micrarchaeota archaeon]|mgnify:CR=1 FL=1|nr:MAG: hypothetical protein DRN74_02075 [Candidatus Micrarchaeota archaeon]